MLLQSLFFAQILLAANIQSPVTPTPLTIVTDESWEVSVDQPYVNEFPLRPEWIPTAKSTLPGGSAYAVQAKYYTGSKPIAGTKPIWRTWKASDNWESYWFRKVFNLEKYKVAAAYMHINCDDAARVYINGRLLDSKGVHGEIVSKDGYTKDYKNLTAYYYNRVEVYDVQPYLLDGAENVIILEVANQPITDNHAYVSARVDIVYSEEKVVEPKSKKKGTTATKPIAKTSVPEKSKPTELPKPTEAATPAATKVFTKNSAIDATKLKVGDVLELGNINFAPDSPDLNSESKIALEELVLLLTNNPKIRLEIGGHTNLIPTSTAFCDKLSFERAQSVAQFLTSRGVHNDRLESKGYGKTTPKMSGTSKAANAQNQRVEIKILAK